MRFGFVVALASAVAAAGSLKVQQRSEATQPPTQNWPTPKEDDFYIDNFKFANGQNLTNLRLHYRTLGTPRKDENGRTANAVLIMHGTGGSSAQFFQDIFAGQLFNPGQLLDANKYFIVVRDGIGHGKSSKPSDSLRARFPTYGYRDMIRADHTLLTEGLGVNHLRLVLGTSMGGMHTWLWSGTYPDFMDAAMPLAALPDQIAGRNRMTRRAIIDAIKLDPAWKGGNYCKQPISGLRSALYTLTWMSSIPLYWQTLYAEPDAADEFLHQHMAKVLAETDANDLLYAVQSSRDYNPKPLLGNITVPLFAVNSADDQINPPELGILEEGIKKVAKGKAVVMPISKDMRGHKSHTVAVLWKQYLRELLESSGEGALQA